MLFDNKDGKGTAVSLPTSRASQSTRPITPKIEPIDDKETQLPGLHAINKIVLPVAAAATAVAVTLTNNAAQTNLPPTNLEPIEPISPSPIRPHGVRKSSSFLGSIGTPLETIHENSVLYSPGISLSSSSLSSYMDIASASPSESLTRPAFQGFKRKTLRGGSEDDTFTTSPVDEPWPAHVMPAPAPALDMPDRSENTRGEPKRSASIGDLGTVELKAVYSSSSPIGMISNGKEKEHIFEDEDEDSDDFYSAHDDSIASQPNLVTERMFNVEPNPGPTSLDDFSFSRETSLTTASERAQALRASEVPGSMRGANAYRAGRGTVGYPNPAPAYSINDADAEMSSRTGLGTCAGPGHRRDPRSLSPMAMEVEEPISPSESAGNNSHFEPMRVLTDTPRSRPRPSLRPTFMRGSTVRDTEVRRESTCEMVRSTAEGYSTIRTRELSPDIDTASTLSVNSQGEVFTRLKNAGRRTRYAIFKPKVEQTEDEDWDTETLTNSQSANHEIDREGPSPYVKLPRSEQDPRGPEWDALARPGSLVYAFRSARRSLFNVVNSEIDKRDVYYGSKLSADCRALWRAPEFPFSSCLEGEEHKVPTDYRNFQFLDSVRRPYRGYARESEEEREAKEENVERRREELEGRDGWEGTMLAKEWKRFSRKDSRIRRGRDHALGRTWDWVVRVFEL